MTFTVAYVSLAIVIPIVTFFVCRIGEKLG